MNQEDSAASMTEEKRRALDKIFNKKQKRGNNPV